MNLTCRIDSLKPFYNFPQTVDVLRLDLLHPQISGNKWFKLKEYLKEAARQQKTIVTFGGAYSNHIAATAVAAKQAGLQAIGLIRGEEAAMLSHTLRLARENGMELYFLTREAYTNKVLPPRLLEERPLNSLYIVPEGGYGPQGVEGAKDILLKNITATYSDIISAVGTGTTLAGLAAAALPHQKITGVVALKNNTTLQQEINALLPTDRKDQFQLLHQFHFGGYAKATPPLFYFMNELYRETAIPTDFVYTAKMFFAVKELLSCGYFTAGARILLVHTGGLQGNLSLPKGTLIFT